ncbi:hypothetical protein FLJC2902T_30550 [Flavobacterium limnosediminis JC2902]|uniref:Uncharacterized protein n=1 Tax=Flavobacterium limnosediminis JC2902 TaxID=1341181 RepID=V6SN67_9FLAO|nr:hypothetical protein FLJC2902T_30550 [Flavobacterium limnosediminis JC2902]
MLKKTLQIAVFAALRVDFCDKNKYFYHFVFFNHKLLHIC